MRATIPASEPLTERERALLHEGVRLNNSGAFFQAHEVLEEAWEPCRSSNRRFLQALIHIAVGNHHAHRGNTAGMERQFAKAIAKLGPHSPQHEGIDVGRLAEAATTAIRLARESGAASGQARVEIPLTKGSFD